MVARGLALICLSPPLLQWYNSVMSAETLTIKDVDAAINQLVEENRVQCLWFIRNDYFPDTTEAQLTILKYIETYGDRAAFVSARRLRDCLLQRSNEKSAA